MRKVAAIITLLFCAFSLRAQERLWIAAKVNDQPATFMFDSGAYDNCLFPEGLRQLGFTNQASANLTDECRLALGVSELRARFQILQTPQFISGTTGVLGWPLLSNNIILIDASVGRIQPLKSLPDDIASWTKIPISHRFPILALRLQDPPGIVLVDTGNPDGFEIPHSAWQRWHNHNRSAPVTLNSAFNPTAGFSVLKISWAKDFTLGSIHLTEVPIGESGPWDIGVGGKNYLGTLGKAALNRLDFIADAPAGVAYIRPKTTPPLPYDHSRIGAAFGPRKGLDSPLIAHVLNDGPAFRAGIRNGDILLNKDGHDMTHWQTSTNHIGFSPPGAKVECALARGSRTFNATIISQQILGPPYEDPALRPRVTNDFSATDFPLQLTPSSFQPRHQ